MEYVDKFYSTLNDNKLVSTVLTTFLIVYASSASPRLPKFMLKLFNNKIFKVLILSLIAYSSTRNPKVSILMAVVFSVTLNILDGKKFFESFAERTDCPEQINEEDINKENYKKLCCCDLNKNGEHAQHIPKCLEYVPENEQEKYRAHVCGKE